MSDAGARASVRRTLSRAARRLRARRLLAELPFALCAGLAGPVLSLLLPPGAPRTGLALATPVLAAAWLGWRGLPAVSPARAAAWLDRRAALADSLTTACWFLDQPRDDAWVQHQRELAAASSRGLDLAELVPLRVAPGPALLAAALALVVILGWRTGAPASSGSATARVADDEAGPRRDPEQPRAEGRPEAGRDPVPQALPLPADLEALAEQLRAGLGEEARERLRELARRAEARRPPDADSAASGAGSADAASGTTLSGEELSGEELAAALAEAAEAMQRGDQEAAAQALEEAAEAAGAERQQRQQAPEEGALPRQASAQDEAAARAPADAGVRWSLDALDPQSLGAEEAQQAARGDAAGPPSGGEPEAGEATELDVELEREALSSESARETEPSEITEEASREQGARIGYRGGGVRRYDAARPLETTEVPWPARERVRRYLLALTREES